MQSPIDRVPQYLAAGSPEGLRRLCLRNNLKKGRYYNYFAIQFVNGKWYAWYYEDLQLGESKGDDLKK